MTGPPQLRFPDFLCIGAQKAGTTWLHNKLRQHPDVWMPPFKELQYFNRVHPSRAGATPDALAVHDARRTANILKAIGASLNTGLPADQILARVYCLSLIARAERSDEWYGRIFGTAPDSAICGEISPDYALLPEAGIEHILRLTPLCKFIFILRDPIERAWSYLRMSERQRDAEIKPRLISKHGCVAYSDYMTTIDRYRRSAPPENLLLLYFDRIETAPSDVLEAVCSFIGVDVARASFKKVSDPVNPGHAKEMDDGIYAEFRSAFAQVYERLLRLEDPIVVSWYERHYK